MKFKLPSGKIDKKKYASVILIFLTVGSTLAYGVLQAVNMGLNNQGGNSNSAQPSLPEGNIIDYELTNEQKNYMLRYGKTILEYKYPLACGNCSSQKAYLESTVGGLSDQLFLEEIVDNSQTRSTLDVSSYYSSRSLIDPSVNATIDALCGVMVIPPVRCATRNV